MAAHWVELGDPDGGEPYFYNPITARMQWVQPDPPTQIPLDDDGTLLLAEDERDRVMPSRNTVKAAGRYDLHHAIQYHGGYTEVAEMLARPPAWPPHNPFQESRRELLREVSIHSINEYGHSSSLMARYLELKTYIAN